jgi:hypothetical protein
VQHSNFRHRQDLNRVAGAQLRAEQSKKRAQRDAKLCGSFLVRPRRWRDGSRTSSPQRPVVDLPDI